MTDLLKVLSKSLFFPLSLATNAGRDVFAQIFVHHTFRFCGSLVKISKGL